MTPVEWIWWLILIVILIVVAWQEYVIAKQNKEFNDELDYSEWLEEKYYQLANIVSPHVTNNLLEFRRELWSEYYYSGALEEEKEDAKATEKD